jgi:ribosomal protein L32
MLYVGRKAVDHTKYVSSSNCPKCGYVTLNNVCLKCDWKQKPGVSKTPGI